MKVILDPPADGPANMQRDADLLESLTDQPLLRIYGWAGDWISYGYFQTQEEAEDHFSSDGLQFVKRPTGGGLVDHRRDLTYTLLLPKAHELARISRSDSYARIHAVVQKALTLRQIDSLLLDEETGGGPACFVHPVPGDIVSPQTGQKLAGAAQRRTRHGLLHQGSILATGLDAETLASAFTRWL